MRVAADLTARKKMRILHKALKVVIRTLQECDLKLFVMMNREFV